MLLFLINHFILIVNLIALRLLISLWIDIFFTFTDKNLRILLTFDILAL